ncbi:MAG: hypothetical protein QXK08_02785 [Candidatus Woesearchaeota archaeon]
MGILNILLALLIPAAAPVAGYFLGRATKEELAAGKKYFMIMQHLLFVSVSAVFLYCNKWSLYLVIPALAAVFAYIAFKQARNAFAVEAVFGLAFAFSVNTNMMFLTSALMFLYGLPTGSLFVRQKKGLYKAAGAGLLFAVVAWTASYFL